jgi:hypothetical protein
VLLKRCQAPLGWVFQFWTEKCAKLSFLAPKYGLFFHYTIKMELMHGIREPDDKKCYTASSRDKEKPMYATYRLRADEITDNFLVEDETAYLMKSEANRKHLLEAVEEVHIWIMPLRHLMNG